MRLPRPSGSGKLGTKLLQHFDRSAVPDNPIFYNHLGPKLHRQSVDQDLREHATGLERLAVGQQGCLRARMETAGTGKEDRPTRPAAESYSSLARTT